jgi:aspartyl-tRNA(Asn)/glutamyl-tRNA(Gln) amidotransferase subunit A
MDHVGPIAPCVRDLALLFQVIAGRDPLDPASADRPVPDLTTLAPPTTPPRLGRVRGLFEERADPAMRAMMDDIARQLTAGGASVVEVALPAGFGEVVARHRTIMAVEAAAFHESRLRAHPDDYDSSIRGLLEEGLACSAASTPAARHQGRLTVVTSA